APLLGGYGSACERKSSFGFDVRDTLGVTSAGPWESSETRIIGFRVMPAIAVAMLGTSVRPTARSQARHGHAGVPSTLGGRQRRAGSRPDPARRAPADPLPRGGALVAATRRPVRRTPSWAGPPAPAGRG